MTFDDWNNIVTANAYWMNLVLVMIILVVFIGNIEKYI